MWSTDKATDFQSNHNFYIFDNLQEEVIVYEIMRDMLDAVADLRLIYANPVSLTSELISQDQSVGKTVTELYSEDISSLHLEIANKVLKTGKGEKYEAYFEDRYYSFSAFSPDENTYVIISADITELKKFENEFKREDNKFKILLESINDAVIISDLETGKYAGVNKKAEELTEYSKEELLSMGIGEITPKDMRTDIIKHLKELSSKGNIEIETEILTKNGKLVPVEVSAEVIEIENKNYVRGILRDISKRKLAEKALKESEEKYRQVVETANSIMVRWKPDGTITYMNPFGLHFFGYEEKELIGKHIDILVPETESTGRDLSNLVQDILQYPQNYAKFENENICKDGSGVWIAWTNHVIFDEQGKPKEVLAVGNDITETKKAQQNVKHQAFLLGQVNDAVIGADSNFKITYWNKGAEKMYSFTENEALGKTTIELLNPTYAPGEREKIIEELELNGISRTTISTKHKNGKEIIAEVNSTLITDKYGNASGYVVVYRDITERKKAEEEVIESKEKYQNLFERMSEGFVLGKMLYDDKGRAYDCQFVEVNQAYAELTGMPLEESLKKTIKQLIPTLEPSWIENHAKVVETGKPLRWENFNEYTGKYYDIYTYRPETGHFASIFTDITDHKEFEEALKINEEKYRTLYNSMNEGVALHKILYNEEGKAINYIIKDVNHAYENILGIKKDEVVDKKASEVYGAEKPPYLDVYSTVAGTGNSKSFETYFEPMDKYFRISVFSPGKEEFATVFDDITERKKTEEQIRFKANALAQISDAVVLIDNQQHIIYWNKGSERLYGVMSEDALGKLPKEIYHSEWLNQEDEKIAYRELEAKGYWHGENIHIKSNGEKIYVDSKIKVLKDKENNPYGMLATIRDVTGRKQAEEHVKTLLGDTQQFAEELEVSNEELQATTEELHVSNEELQATTEELHVANEELRQQSGELLSINEALRKSEESSWQQLAEIEAIYNSAPIGLCIFDRELRYLRINEYMAKLNGLPVDDHIGKTPRDIVPDLTDLAEKIAEKVFKTGESVLNVEFSGMRPANPEIVGTWIEHWVPLKDHNDNIIGINVAALDVTELKNIQNKLKEAHDNLEELVQERTIELEAANISLKESEEDLKELVKKLRESETHFRTLTENSPDLIMRLDKGLNLIYVNSIVEKITGYSPESFIDGNIEDIAIPQEYMSLWKEEFQKVFETGKIRHKEFEFPTVSGLKAFEMVTVPEYNDKSEIKSILSINRDITERKEAEEQLKKLVEDLKRSNEELERFAYVASHDLQEPLRTIASFTQLLERRYKGKFDSDADEFMDYIVEAAIRMKEQIEGLLEYSRIATKGKEFEPVFTNSILDHVVNNLHVAIKECNGEITHDQLPNVTGDAGQLQRVFQNLISNAIKFRREGEPPKIHISATKDEENNEYVFSVSDNGIGIEEQYIERIFVIFQRLHTMDVYKGTGIGLSIVKRIIERHGGRVWVESEFGRGSTFYFTLLIN